MQDDDLQVSILLPVYNGFPFLPDAIESISKQTERRWKLIVVNDGSTDESKSYLETLTDPRIQVVHQENKGLSPALNTALELSKTKYIARMDGDDVSYPQRLEKQIAFLNENREVGMLGTQIHRIGSRRTDNGSNLPLTHDQIFQTLLEGHHAICHPTIMCRKKAFEEVGGYTEGLGEEWDLFLRFGENWKLANHPEILFGYRYHSTSINGSRMDELRRRIRHKCECSRRRAANQPELTYAEFVDEENEQSYLRQFTRRMEDYSRANYHCAMADILGDHPFRGYARLGFAAASAPHIAIQRLARKLFRPVVSS